MTNCEMLKKVIESKGIKYSYIADQLGITASSLSKKVSGEREFKQNEISRMSRLLKLSATEIKRIFFAVNVDKKST